jgi:hypothetical protein
MTLAMILEKFSQASLGDAEMRRPKRFPKLFAASVCAGIISAGLMANEILQPCSFPCFCGFAPLHKADRRKAQAKSFGGSSFTYEIGPVAQRLEQGTHNPLVPGSNPGGPNLRTAKVSLPRNAGRVGACELSETNNIVL